jgi:hypothetical protein
MTALAAGAVFLGAGLQSATGFGFALVAAPLLFAVLGPEAAVSAAILLGLEVNLLTLAGERRAPAVLRGEAARLVAWSLPGVAAGTVVLVALPDDVLAGLVGVAVLVALAVRLRGAPAPAGPAAWRTAAAGSAAGALSTATALSGPPLVLHLLARGTGPAQLRDTLAAVFLALGVLSAAALAAAGAFDLPAALGLLAAAALAGHLLGRRVFARLDGGHHERVVLAVLGLSAVAALASSVA